MPQQSCENSQLQVDSISTIISCKIGYLGILCILAMIVLNSLDVLLRWFNMGILGMMEITEILLGVMSFLSFSWCYCEDKHIKIEVFTEHLPQKARCVTGIFGTIIGLVFFGAITWGSFDFLIESYTRNEFTPLLGIPLYPVKAIVLIGSFIFTLQLFSSFLIQINKFFRGI